MAKKKLLEEREDCIMTAEEWNGMYPPGTLVRYFPIKGHLDEYEDLLTRSEAWDLCHGEPVVKLQSKAGGCCLSHITPLEEPTPR